MSITTQAAVQAALENHLTSTLAGAFPTLVVTHSLEAATELYEQQVPFLCITLHSHELVQRGQEHQWGFLIQCSTAHEVGTGNTTDAAVNADLALIDAMNAAINGDSGYTALRSAGLELANCKAMAEDQRTADFINPHIFTCSTFA